MVRVTLTYTKRAQREVAYFAGEHDAVVAEVRAWRPASSPLSQRDLEVLAALANFPPARGGGGSKFLRVDWENF